MKPGKWIARHLRCPSGLFGLLVARKMNQLNRVMNERTVAELGIQSADRVLEIGFGGGLALPLLLKAASAGAVAGVELSDTMLRRARRRFRGPLGEGRLSLQPGVADALPFGPECFDKVCTVNTIYFWPDVAAGVREIRRVTKAGGRLAIAYRPKEELLGIGLGKDRGFTLRTDAEIAELLHSGGFGDIRVVRGQDETLGYACVIAQRSPYL